MNTQSTEEGRLPPMQPNDWHTDCRSCNAVHERHSFDAIDYDGVTKVTTPKGREYYSIKLVAEDMPFGQIYSGPFYHLRERDGTWPPANDGCSSIEIRGAPHHPRNYGRVMVMGFDGGRVVPSQSEPGKLLLLPPESGQLNIPPLDGPVTMDQIVDHLWDFESQE